MPARLRNPLGMDLGSYICFVDPLPIVAGVLRAVFAVARKRRTVSVCKRGRQSVGAVAVGTGPYQCPLKC